MFEMVLLLNYFFIEHVDDVRAQVQRAVKDLSIEQSLKTYDEVWLSKIFELRPHTRIRTEIDVTPTNPVSLCFFSQYLIQSSLNCFLQRIIIRYCMYT